MFATEP